MASFLLANVSELWAWTHEYKGEAGIIGVMGEEGFQMLVSTNREALEEDWATDMVAKIQAMSGGVIKLSRFTLHDTVRMLGGE